VKLRETPALVTFVIRADIVPSEKVAAYSILARPNRRVLDAQRSRRVQTVICFVSCLPPVRVFAVRARAARARPHAALRRLRASGVQKAKSLH
jgi:hypothetical protein